LIKIGKRRETNHLDNKEKKIKRRANGKSKGAQEEG